MIRKISTYLLSAICFILLASAASDEDWLTALLYKLDVIRTSYPQEKVHLHTDKPYYAIGDDVWIKAYVVNAENNELSALSKVLYIDIVDDSDSIRKTVALQLANGLSNGVINLSDSTFNTGRYRINAYTRWMQNFDTKFIFSKNIWIGNAREQLNVIADARLDSISDDGFRVNIKFSGSENKSPLAGKPFTYSLVNQNGTLSNGKVITSGTGDAFFNIKVKNWETTNGLILRTSIKLANGNTITQSFPIKTLKGKLDVQFFPEGGRLVAGLRSKVAFKVLSSGGLSAEIKGKVVNNHNKIVAEFTTAHAGMGVFALQPVAADAYTAVIDDRSGGVTRYPLPSVDAQGYVLSINHLTDSVGVQVASSNLLIGKEVALIAQQNGVVKYATKINLNQPVINAHIPESKFSTGLVVFTLLSTNAQPLAERLIFVNHHDHLRMKVNFDKPFYGKREQVNMVVSVEDAAGRPTESNLSIAVTNVAKVAVDSTEASIYASLLLTSDIKGYVENPNYYFAEGSEDKTRHLDNLLLTQGWRRFKWTDLTAYNSKPLIYQPQQSLDITGKMTTINDKPIANGKVTLYGNTSDGIVLLDTTTDADGKFIFENLDFVGTSSLVIRAKNAKNTDNVKITLDRPGNLIVPVDYDATLLSNSGLVSFLQNIEKTQKTSSVLSNKVIVLNEVKVKDRSYLQKNSVAGSSKLGNAYADIVIKKDRIAMYPQLVHAFYGLPGIQVKGNGIYSIGRTISLTKAGGSPMLIVLDGVQVGFDVLMQISPYDVEGIEILKPGVGAAIYGTEGYWGVVVVTLKKGGGDLQRMQQTGLARIKLPGYAEDKEFYTPLYDKQKADNNYNGQRSTIFWQPNLVTNAAGNAKLSFYTADEPATYRIVAEGININGKLLRQEFYVDVKEK
ncbi:hypothetical protein DYU05_01970 [Mucilaginibacter terrenus]|uniref:TonB-dependent receptor plug domain-containing protein n=1 Tax=Mucilaginibacter terrenus TaxID=2482727 RepID=A0A3E2NTS1_9SPHI|nr:TonB-dependent receptor plug domain-containing protein [Mucilaginibacter terrenus]RFZ84415.1 hypothetical protein DYU05_01970 [Mucilaginibacter terrenus]